MLQYLRNHPRISHADLYYYYLHQQVQHGSYCDKSDSGGWEGDYIV